MLLQIWGLGRSFEGLLSPRPSSHMPLPASELLSSLCTLQAEAILSLVTEAHCVHQRCHLRILQEMLSDELGTWVAKTAASPASTLGIWALSALLVPTRAGRSYFSFRPGSSVCAL